MNIFNWVFNRPKYLITKNPIVHYNEHSVKIIMDVSKTLHLIAKNSLLHSTQWVVFKGIFQRTKYLITKNPTVHYNEHSEKLLVGIPKTW